jgi:hypothetical protein
MEPVTRFRLKMTDFSTPGPEQWPLAPRDARSREFDQVQATVQALQGAASLLQGAMEQRQELVSEMRSAEESLALIQHQRVQAEQALANATSQLERAARDVEQVRSEQNGVVAEFDKLVQGALARRGALVSEIAELERQRDTLAQFPSVTLSPPPTPSPSFVPEPSHATTPETVSAPSPAVSQLVMTEPLPTIPAWAPPLAEAAPLAPPAVPDPPVSATPMSATPAAELEWLPVANAWLPVAQPASVAAESAPVDLAPRPWAASQTPLARAAEQAPRILPAEPVFAPVSPPQAIFAAEAPRAVSPPRAIFVPEPLRSPSAFKPRRPSAAPHTVLACAK